MATDQAGYRLADNMDSEVLQYMTTQVPSAQLVGTTGSPQAVAAVKTSGKLTPLQLLNRLKRYLNENNVPQENRWFVADPYFFELLEDEDSKLIHNDTADKGILRNGQVVSSPIRGFSAHLSNNLLSAGAGPSGTTSSDYGWILAGHMSSTATAEQINKTESFRDPDSFADVVRGLHMYGRKTLRTESLVGAVYNSA